MQQANTSTLREYLMGLTPIQLNVLQVAIDQMEEHLADVASTGLDGLTQQTRADVSASAVEDLEEKVQVLQRLIAAKQVKAELKALIPTN